MQETVNFLKEAGTFYLATVDKDKAKVRPFGAVAVFEDKLYICTNNKKDVFKQMKENPNVEISATVKGSWIRIGAKAIQDDRKEARQAMLDQNPGLEDMYKVDDGIFEVLYLQDATSTIASFTGEPKVEKF